MVSARTRKPTLKTKLCIAAVLVAAIAGWRWIESPRSAAGLALPAQPMQGEPRLMLWAWETPEELSALDPRRAGVAFLAGEVFLGQTAQVRPRRQPLHLANDAWLMAVVRLQTTPGFVASSDLQQQTAAAILASARLPHVRALQVDFDAAASQRDFYAGVLRRVAAAKPAALPLSITALVSWCGPHSWLRSLPSGPLPVDEAVPMFFRMGGPAATRASAPRSNRSIGEPLCAASLGVATDEAWPPVSPAQRVYVFRPGPWTAADIQLVNLAGYEGLYKGGERPTAAP